MAISSVVLLLLLVSSTTAAEECPPFFEWVNTSTSCGYCACDTEIPENIICDQKGQRSSIRLPFCVFYDSEKDDIVAANCPFLFPKSILNDNVFPLPRDIREVNTFVCGNLSREVKGPLCGKCTGDTGSSIYSVGSECVPCSPVNVVYYILLQYLPTTLLFLAVLFFRVNVTAAPMAHYVLFCNLMVFYSKFTLGFYTRLYSTSEPYISTLGKLVITLNAVWSFDALFFLSPPLCISIHMEDIYKPFLEFLATLYPFILLLLTYVAIELHARDFKPIVTLWRLFHRVYVRFYKTWEPNASIIQSFSSLFFLSYAKLNFLMMIAFISSPVFNTEGHVEQHMVFIDPTIPFLATKHILLIVFSLFVALFLYLPPLLLLIVYPTALYRKISQRIKPKWTIGITTYVDTFQGCLKDGTNGTRDYRVISGYSLVLLGFFPVMLQYVTIAALPDSFAKEHPNIHEYIMVIFFPVVTVLCSLVQPYKHWAANASAMTVLTLLTAVFSLSTGLTDPQGGNVVRVMILIINIIPHCALGGYVVWKVKTTCQRRYRNTCIEDGEREKLIQGPINTALNYNTLVETVEK